MNFKKIIPIFLLLVIALVAGWFYKAYKTVPELPAFQNSFISEQGQPMQITDFKGSYVLVSYFQTWCGSCIRELPSMDALQMTVGKDKLKVLLISDEPMDKILRFKEKYCNTLEYYHSAKSFPEISIRIFPTTYLLNPKGEVIFSKLDAMDWNTDEVKKMFGQ